ncbi:MAG: hypothetical protein AB1630_01390 [bacterium]
MISDKEFLERIKLGIEKKEKDNALEYVPTDDKLFVYLKDFSIVLGLSLNPTKEKAKENLAKELLKYYRVLESNEFILEGKPRQDLNFIRKLLSN